MGRLELRVDLEAASEVRLTRNPPPARPFIPVDKLPELTGPDVAAAPHPSSKEAPWSRSLRRVSGAKGVLPGPSLRLLKGRLPNLNI